MNTLKNNHSVNNLPSRGVFLDRVKNIYDRIFFIFE
jgi:hypothetical protein